VVVLYVFSFDDDGVRGTSVAFDVYKSIISRGFQDVDELFILVSCMILTAASVCSMFIAILGSFGLAVLGDVSGF